MECSFKQRVLREWNHLRVRTRIALLDDKHLVDKTMKFFLTLFLIGCGILAHSVFDLVIFYFHSEEEEAEEAEEDKDKDSLSSADSSRNATPKISSKPSRTVDLGAAANYGKSEVTNSSSTQASSVVPSMSHTSNSDLVDLLTGRPDTSLASQPVQTFTVPVVSTESDSFFADFASAPTGGGSISGSENNFNSGKELVIITFHEVLKMYMYG